MTVLRNALLLCLTWSLLTAPDSRADTALTLSADIGPRPVAEALAAFSRQTGLQLIYVSTIAETQQSKGARAGLTAAEALTQLLDGTGLQFEFLNARTVRIYPAPPVVPTALASVPVPQPSAEHRAGSSALGLEEIVVTATRREELANRVPISMVVWSQEAMEASGIKSIGDLGALTPAVEFDFFPEDGAGVYTNISIRGINDRNGTTVGMFLDDTAVPAPGDWGGAFGRAFPLVFDLDRVEVLRGPQGTYLGEGTQAGAVRLIANQPSLTNFSTVAHIELGATARGDLSYELGAAAGGPLVENVMGFRVSAWRRSDGGFVDRVDPFTSMTVDENANRSLSKSVRGALTIAPADNLRISPAITYQSISINDSSSFYTYLSDPAAGRLDNGKLLRQPVDDIFYLASVKLTAGLNLADFAFVTSYLHRTAAATVDATNNSAFGGWGNPLGPEYPVSYANAIAVPIGVEQKVLSQEARLASTNANAALVWLTGLTFSRAHNQDFGNTWAIGMEEWGPLVVSDGFKATQTQTALYGELGLRPANRISADIGMRIGHAYYESESRTPVSAVAQAAETTKTPRLSVSYQTEAHDLVYATISKGYRMGGVNLPAPHLGCNAPPNSYAPDSLWSYEIGTKNRVFGDRLHLEASIFHVHWSGLQLLLATDHANTPCGYIGNAGSATSNGFDLTVRAQLTDRFKVNFVGAYTDAHYAQTVKVGDTVIVGKGDALGALPMVPSPWNIVTSFEYAIAFGGGATANGKVENISHSRNPGPFTSRNPASLLYAPDRRPDPWTDVLNARATVTWPTVDMALFVNNIFDSQPTLLRRNRCCADTLFYATTFRPRTVGISLTYRF